ncbi:MAG: hypothetical protein DIZ80_04540 [endosymbiont of Galathealinum brachiosum]|uniref:Uncharacterized protein n=1 Tax=endosymbiont of Galathealinum brachiosum TaxID=2200906 RepID=A0A370DJI9_9GAMM|nr:MAG: hypothetical protein DIZ80_04540 [endosymbiont of Galathealinum brachiosum]
MESQHYANRAGWTIILYGVCLSFITAFTPFFEAGYLFQDNILLAGLFPYLIYAIAVPLLPGTITTVAGIVLAATHTGLVIGVRFLNYNEGLMYSIPVILAVLLIPLVIFALIKTDVHKHDSKMIGH